MIKRLLLTAAMGFTLGTAAFAQTAADPAKTDAGAPTAAQASTTPNVIGPERNRIANAIDRQNVKALKGVDFSVTVGSSVPRELRVYPMPADVVQIVPQYRNYRFLVVEKEIAILDPATRKIVTVLPREATETATATATPTATPVAPAASTTSAAVTPAAVTPAPVTPAAQAQAPQPQPAATPSAPTQSAAAQAAVTSSPPTQTAPTTSAPTQAAQSQPAQPPVAQATPAPSAATPSAPPAQQSAEQSPAPANEQAQAAPAKKQASVERAKRRAARAEARRAYGEVRVGQRIPDNVRLYDLPPDIRAEVPQSAYRSGQPRARSYVAGPRSRLYYEYD